jgi:hypothetical protein
MEPQKYIVTVFQNRTEWRNEEGLLHRLDGPAIEYTSGSKEWYVNGELHRLDGPATEYSHGTTSWWVNGELHRLDGPAIEWSDGYKSWYIEGKKHTEAEFNEKVKQLKNNSCEGKIVEIEGKKYKLTSV